MDSLDLSFDEATEACIRADWERLVAAGLPSLALHRAPSHRPHLTLLTAPSLAPELFPGLDERVARAVGPLERPLQSSGVLLLGPRRDRYVVTRHVVATPELLELRRRVLMAVGLPEVPWVPHITLSRRLTAEQLATALPLLGPMPDQMRIVGLRRWNHSERTVSHLV